MTRRRKLSRLQRIGVFDRAGGVCCLCPHKIDFLKEKWIVEHIKPLWLGGADDETNMGPAHERCAIDKTAGEAPVKAKGDRIRARHLGIKKPRTITRWRKMNRERSPVYASRER
jgi:5-methylcytosine-specific restriction enzyme A